MLILIPLIDYLIVSLTLWLSTRESRIQPMVVSLIDFLVVSLIVSLVVFSINSLVVFFTDMGCFSHGLTGCISHRLSGCISHRLSGCISLVSLFLDFLVVFSINCLVVSLIDTGCFENTTRERQPGTL